MGATIGERVKHVRRFYGWTQDELAAMAGVSQPAISSIERGGGAAPETVDALARASHFSSEFFTRGPLPDLPTGSFKYRKTTRARVSDDDRVRAQVRHVIEALDRLTIAKPPPVRLRPAADPHEVVDGDFIETIARECREWMGVGPYDPIPNVVRAAERAGVIVVQSGDEVAGHLGLSYWPMMPIGLPIVWFARGMPGDRERFTVAHEIGHLLLHQYRTVPTKRAEDEAHHFARALLMPLEVMADAIPTPVTLRHLAHAKANWGIAISALVRRCREAGMIDDDRRLSLEKQINSRGWRKNEPVEVRQETPTLLRRLMEHTFGTVEPRPLSKQLGIPPIAAKDLVAV